MFTLITQINNVTDPVISGLGVVYTDSGTTLVKAGKNFDYVSNHLNVPFEIIGVSSDEMIVQLSDKILSLDVTATITEEYPLAFTGHSQIKLFYDNDIMIIWNNTGQEWKLYKYDFRRSQLIWERTDNYAHQFSGSGHYLIATHTERNDLLSCYDETNGAPLWQVSINELGLPGTGYKLADRPLLYNNYILAGVRTGRDICLLALDIDTGKLRWVIKGPGLRFQPDNDRILCFSGGNILQIDLSNGAIIHSVAVLDTMLAADIDPHGNVVFKDQEMYLTGTLDTMISVWEINTGKLLWNHRLYDKSLTGRRGIVIQESENMLQVHDNRMYILDSERVLHVFEKI